MSEVPDPDRVRRRAADLLPEERASGSDDAQREAEIILEDSDARTADPEGARAASSQTPDRGATTES